MKAELWKERTIEATKAIANERTTQLYTERSNATKYRTTYIHT